MWHSERCTRKNWLIFLNKYRVVIETKFSRVLQFLRALLIISPRRCVKSHERNINGINKLSGLTRMTMERGKVSERYFPLARESAPVSY